MGTFHIKMQIFDNNSTISKEALKWGPSKALKFWYLENRLIFRGGQHFGPLSRFGLDNANSFYHDQGHSDGVSRVSNGYGPTYEGGSTKEKIYTRYFRKFDQEQENHKFWTFCLWVHRQHALTMTKRTTQKNLKKYKVFR
jgi:hypothetical protein